MLGLDTAYLCSKFDHSSFSCSRDMVGAHQNLNGLHDLTTPLSGMFCHPRASTCYDQLRLLLAPFQSYREILVEYRRFCNLPHFYLTPAFGVIQL